MNDMMTKNSAMIDLAARILRVALAEYARARHDDRAVTSSVIDLHLRTDRVAAARTHLQDAAELCLRIQAVNLDTKPVQAQRCGMADRPVQVVTQQDPAARPQ